VGVFKNFWIETVGGGEAAGNDRKHASDVGAGLLHGDAGLQTGETRETEIPEAGFLAFKFVCEKQRAIVPIEKMEGGRENADDLVGLAVGDDGLTDGVGIAGKLTLPIAVTDDDGAGGAGFGVFGAEEAAELGSDAENGEDAVADVEGLNLFWFAATGDADGIS